MCVCVCTCVCVILALPTNPNTNATALDMTSFLWSWARACTVWLSYRRHIKNITSLITERTNKNFNESGRKSVIPIACRHMGTLQIGLGYYWFNLRSALFSTKNIWPVAINI